MILEKLKSLELELPKIPSPVASYLPAKKSGNQILVSGQLPLLEGELISSGTLKKGDDIKNAQAAMKQSFLNGLAAAMSVANENEIVGVLKLGAFVSCTSDFCDHHLVANGASDLAQQIFGERGRHVRFAIGVPSLPLNATVELELIFEI